MEPKNRAKKDPTEKMPEELVENSAVDEFFSRLSSDVRHAKPGDEAVAVVMDALQRLTTESDSEAVTEIAVSKSSDGPSCMACGSSNRVGNRFCSNCGVPLNVASAPQPVEVAPPTPASSTPAAGQHHYHHHYHHHYFSDSENLSGAGPVVANHTRGAVPAVSVREIGRPRIATGGAAMSRAEAAATRVIEDWVLSCNTKHLDDLVALYIADGLVLRPNVPPVRGAAPIREFFFTALGSGFGEVEMEPVRLEVLGDVAYQAGRCKSLVPSVAGKRREERGKYLIILVRQSNGEWKIASDCWSNDLSLPGEIEAGSSNSNAPGREGKR